MLSQGAAFDSDGERIRAPRGPIPGRCRCACGWLSEVQPNIPARWNAYKAHQDEVYVTEGRHISAHQRRRWSRTIYGRCGFKPREVVAPRFWKFVHRPNDEPDTCWVWTGSKSNGYGSFDHTGAHRVALWLATGEEPGDRVVLHRCDNPPCVRPSHLTLGTHQANMADKQAKGRARGPIKVTEDQVTKIRERYAAGASARDLAQEYGVSPAQAARIVAGHSRGTVPLPEWKQRGMRARTSKLTDDQVREIREKYATGKITQRALAATYGIDQGYLSALINLKERAGVV